MKILLLQCNWRYHDQIYPNLGSIHPYQPIELCYIGALLQPNHTVFLLDAFSDNLSFREIAARVGEINPDLVVAATANTYLFWRCCFPDVEVVSQTLGAIRQVKKAPTILFGPHGTVEPHWTLKQTGADFLVRGEPEIALQAFIDSNLMNDQLPGIFSPRHSNNPVAVVDELTALPPPAYDLLNMRNYKCHSWIRSSEFNFQRGVLLEYSRGCRFHCNFCFRKGFREKYRMKTAAQIMAEIKMLKAKYAIDYIFFIDDIFNIDNENFRGLLMQLKELNIAYGCQCRPDIMTTEIIDLMQESGCVYIEYGLESLNPENRKQLKKNEELFKTMRLINYTQKKIKFVTYNLLDFTTFELITHPNLIKKTNEGDSVLQITSETDALETIVLFPQTGLSETVSRVLHMKNFTWEDTIRLYWLSSMVKTRDHVKEYQIILWRWICLHIPFKALKTIMRYQSKIKPLPVTLARKVKANE